MGRWQDNELLRGMAQADLTVIGTLIKEERFEQDEVIFNEGDEGQKLYMLIEGQVAVSRHEGKAELHLVTLGEGDYFGEMALMDEVTRSATVRAVTPVLACTLSREQLEQGARDEAGRVASIQMLRNLGSSFSRRMRASNDQLLGALHKELDAAHERLRLSLMLIAVVLGTWFYSAMVVELTHYPDLRRITSLGISVGAMGAAVWYLRTSPHPMSTYGLTWKNLKPALRTCVPWTLGFIGFLTLLKWALVTFTTSYAHLPVFKLRFLDFEHPALSLAGMVVVYLLVSALQEFAARSFSQTSFDMLLQGRRAGIWSILLSNALYSMFHMHYSSAVAFGSFFIGLFFGFLWLKHRSLPALALSHFIVGFWCIEVLNVLPLLGMKAAA